MHAKVKHAKMHLLTLTLNWGKSNAHNLHSDYSSCQKSIVVPIIKIFGRYFIK